MSMQNSLPKDAAARSKAPPGLDAQGTVYRILIAISLVHLFNDSIQSVIPAIFPILKDSMHLTYTQIGWISFAINFTASIMQPVVGWFADKKPTPSILPIGMGFTFTGMLLLAFADSYMACSDLRYLCWSGLGGVSSRGFKGISYGLRASSRSGSVHLPGRW